MAQPKFFPQTPAAMVEFLLRRAPEPRISPTTSRDESMFDAGRRSLALEVRDYLSTLQKASGDVPS